MCLTHLNLYHLYHFCVKIKYVSSKYINAAHCSLEHLIRYIIKTAQRFISFRITKKFDSLQKKIEGRECDICHLYFFPHTINPHLNPINTVFTYACAFFMCVVLATAKKTSIWIGLGLLNFAGRISLTRFIYSKVYICI